MQKLFFLLLVWASIWQLDSNNLVASNSFEYTHSGYDWAATPNLHELSSEELEKSAVVVKDKRIFEYVYDNNSELVLFHTMHKIVRVNDDQAIESYNKVFLPMSNVTDLVTLKARAIAADGTITDLKRENIKELENVRNLGNFKIFAIEGIGKGGELEYFYTTKSYVREPYDSDIFQTDTQTKEAVIEIISPQNLHFIAKGYNGFPTPELVRNDSIRILKGVVKNMPPLLEENYAMYRANLMKVAYKLAGNKGISKKEPLYGWAAAADWFKSIIYTASESTEKEIKSLLEKEKIDTLKGEAQIIALESYIKENITLTQGGGAEVLNVGKILVNKYASEVGVARLFAAILEASEIEHELVLTSNRYNSKFDKEFEDWNNFTEIMFYFPKYDKYVMPAAFQFRFGAPPYQLANNYGLFVKDEKTWSLKEIKMPKAEESTNKIAADISFDEEFNVVLDMEYGWTGYRATEFRMIYDIQKEEFIDSRVKSGIADAKVLTTEVDNVDLKDSSIPNKPFTIKSQLEANSLIEKAGKSYLFKLGEVIGEQVELYQKHERQNQIDMPYPTYYRRSMSFKIPDGYRLEGLEDVKIDKFVKEKGEKVNRFISDYTIKDDVVTITADEYYNKISMEKKDYEAFREVINAAADFNKVVLVFEKK